MDRRQRWIAGGMASGMAWAVGLLALGAALTPPREPLAEALMHWMLLPGLVLLATIGRLAQRRFFDPAITDGEAPAPGSPAETDLRVLVNTAEQCLLAVLVWPALLVQLPPENWGVLPALACGFVLARLAFWIGYHRSGPARAFGFAATFYPTALAALWALWLLLTTT